MICAHVADDVWRFKGSISVSFAVNDSVSWLLISLGTGQIARNVKIVLCSHSVGVRRHWLVSVDYFSIHYAHVNKRKSELSCHCVCILATLAFQSTIFVSYTPWQLFLREFICIPLIIPDDCF